MSVTVWVAEEVLDHQPGYVRGVFSSRALAMDSVIVGVPLGTEWTIHYHDDGSVSLSSGRYAGTCVSIEPHEIDVGVKEIPA